jgi:hypothetical protein
MLRTILAGITGAIAAIVVAFVIVAVLSAVRGVPVMYEPTRAECGWEGAQYGMLLFVGIGIMMVWPFPAIVLAGAAIGIVTRMVLHKHAR